MIFCNGPHCYGAEKVELTLMKGLINAGHEVLCVASLWNDGVFPQMLDAYHIPYVQLPFIKLGKRLSYIGSMIRQLLRWPEAWLRTRWLLRNFRPDMIVMVQEDTAFLVRGLLRGQQCVYHVHGIEALDTLLRQFRRWFTDGVIRRYVAVSRFVGDKLSENGAPVDKIKVIYNGLELAGSPSARGEGIQLARVRIGIVGQVGAWKGHLDFVEALGLLAKKGLPFEGHIFGEGSSEFKADLRRKIGTLGLEGRITWHGYERDTEAIFQSLDLITAPSIAEDPAPLVACEAGLRGLPAVVTRRGGLPEIVEDGVTGFVVEAQRPDQLADRLERLITDPGLRRTMGGKARERIAERFSQERMVTEFEALCRELASHA